MTPAPRKKRLPSLPPHIFSLLGPIPVTECEEIVEQKEAFGLMEFSQREITVDANSGRETQWQVLGHEIAHLVLWDGAIHQKLDEQTEEMICDAFGTYIAAAVQAGYLKFTEPKTK